MLLKVSRLSVKVILLPRHGSTATYHPTQYFQSHCEFSQESFLYQGLKLGPIISNHTGQWWSLQLPMKASRFQSRLILLLKHSFTVTYYPTGPTHYLHSHCEFPKVHVHINDWTLPPTQYLHCHWEFPNDQYLSIIHLVPNNVIVISTWYFKSLDWYHTMSLSLLLWHQSGQSVA